MSKHYGRMQFEVVLTDIGLSEKEARVYIAALELGSSPVQPIARKAKVARATTYVVLESLMARGLITKLHEGKKTLFVAESPRHLLQYVEMEEQRAHEKHVELDEILPELLAFMRAAEGKPVTRYFAGPEGVRTMRNEIIRQCSNTDIWYSLIPADHFIAVLGEKELLAPNARVAKRIRAKTIFTTRSSKRKE